MKINLIESIKEKGEFYLDPWPHMIVKNVLDENLADMLGENWPTIGLESDVGKTVNIAVSDPQKIHPLWQKFYTDIIEQGYDLNRYMCEVFKGFCKSHNPKEKFDEIRLRIVKEDQERMIKPWHTDNKRKKFTGLMYFDNPVGRLELFNFETTKVIEPESNMYVFWPSSKETVHRFFAGPGTRKSVSISANHLKE